MTRTDDGTLLPCPCGKTPSALVIQDSNQGGKWGIAMGDCCNEWNVEFRTDYFGLDSPECMERAVKYWNLAPRAHQQGSLPVEAIEYALATMDLELDYLCTQYSQRPEESGERDTWKRRVALCKAHIESLKALLPPNTEAKS